MTMMSNTKADSIERMAALQCTLNTDGQITTAKKTSCIKTGRGSTAGWTTCPLCNQQPHKQKLQVRRYALGRGIASHLHAIHTPWLPQKSKKRKLTSSVVVKDDKTEQTTQAEVQHSPNQPTKRQRRELECMSSNYGTSGSVDDVTQIQPVSQPPSSNNNNGSEFLWIPTPKEIEEWNTKVIQIVTSFEQKAIVEAVHHAPTSLPLPDDIKIDTTIPSSNILPPGYDRNGKILLSSVSDLSSSYQTTLPKFITAAADGDLQQLTNMVESVVGTDGNQDNTHEDENIRMAVQQLINTRDRHGSIAEHWAAGGGHLKCLQYLIQLRQQYDNDNLQISNFAATANGNRRRRDGKTCLHYAARNGHIECIKYIIDHNIYKVDVTSNDGTTPLHLACYGGQIDVIWYLIEQCHADVHQTNDYGCGVVHWIGLSPTLNNIADQEGRVVELLSKLCDMYGVSIFCRSQKHGHTILHKAAQKLNRTIIEYFLRMNHLTPEQNKLIGGIPDTNGHTVSTIWRSFGGNEAFAQLIQRERNW